MCNLNLILTNTSIQMKKFPILTLLFIFLIAPLANGQETGSKKFQNPEWFEIVQVKYKAGKKEKAQSLIKDYFMATGQAAGLPGPHMTLDMVSGEWDMVFLWKMEEGIETLNYEISPTGAKFRKAFMEKVGGEEKAQQIWEEYYSYIQDWNSEIARKWN